MIDHTPCTHTFERELENYSAAGELQDCQTTGRSHRTCTAECELGNVSAGRGTAGSRMSDRNLRILNCELGN